MTSNGERAVERMYRGKTADERRASRRERLVEAGLELFGTEGYGATSIRAILRESGLGERYFYESFDTLEDLLIAVHEEVQQRVQRAVLKAVGGSFHLPIDELYAVGMLAVVETMTGDLRMLRIAMVETVGVSDRVEAHRQHVLEEMADIIVASAGAYGEANPVGTRILSFALVGAANELMSRWASGALPIDLPTLVEYLVALFRGTLDYAIAHGIARVPDSELDSELDSGPDSGPDPGVDPPA